MFRSNNNKSGAKIHRRGCKTSDCFFAAFNFVSDVNAFFATNPIPLGGLNLLRPVDLVDVTKQSVGIVGNLEKPLIGLFSHRRRLTPLTHPALDLLVGQNRFTARAPVDHRFFPDRQPFLKHLDKQPLGPFVVLGIVSLQTLFPGKAVTDAG